jgi:eukaryotic-like serine/threonine-protein kinase
MAAAAGSIDRRSEWPHGLYWKSDMGDYVIIPGRMLQIGDQFDQYQILEHMAQGGMSEVYRAYDVINHRDVVIKIPDQSIIGDPGQFERFQRELEVMNTLNHPAILKGLGSGKYNRIPYLVTALVEGQSLRKLIETSAPMPPDLAADLIRKVADGMAYCHANGVIHRDLKPENILVTTEGQPIIMDFGLALTKGSHRVTYSNLTATMGTPDYMAPEQIEGQRGDQRTDVYALGTILFELLAGRLPFSGDNNLAVMALHMNGTAPRLDRLAPEVSPALAAVTAHALQRDPNRRYPDMPAFIAALDHPELADLAILDEIGDGKIEKPSFWRSTEFRAIALAFAILAFIIVLAVLLQALKN